MAAPEVVTPDGRIKKVVSRGWFLWFLWGLVIGHNRGHWPLLGGGYDGRGHWWGFILVGMDGLLGPIGYILDPYFAGSVVLGWLTNDALWWT